MKRKMKSCLPSVIIYTKCIICGLKCDGFYRNVNRQISDQPKSVDAIKMAYRLFKDESVKSDVPIIVMHGLFGSKKNWNSLGVSILKRTKKLVYAVDARNHGDSPNVNEHSYIHLAEDLKLFISDINAKKAALIGHSMGGRAVMVFALRYPQAVESLTVLDISPVDPANPVDNPIATTMEFITAMQAVKFKSGFNLSRARSSAKKQLAAKLGNKQLAKFLSMNVIKTPSGTFTWKVNLDSISKNFEPYIMKFPIIKGEFKGPTLFVIGGESNFLSLDDVDKIKLLFPNSTFEIIEDSGHLVHVENPKLLIRLVCDFIKKSAEKE